MDSERTPLLTDLYELTMLQTYLEHGMRGEAVFEFFLRDAGPLRPFFVAAGAEAAADWLESLRFGDEELQWVRDCGHFSDGFADALRDWRFTGTVRAMPEGTVCFPDEPILQVVAPLPEAQLIESRLMNIVHGQTLFATKAARCRLAAGTRKLVDFGLRRAHGGEAGLWAARSNYLAGFDATATCLAGARYGIPLSGTMAHSFVLAHADEREAFLRFARSHPDNVILLIDTFDVADGARQAVAAAEVLRGEGITVKGVRIDSGDLAAHARHVRGILDDGGLEGTAVLVSGGLDEYAIADLVADGAPIDGFGVGSKVDTSADVPFLDCAYKLHEYDGVAVGKRSENKHDLPGRKQVFRRIDDTGTMDHDVLAIEGEEQPGRPLLETFMQGGRRSRRRDDLEAARQRCAGELDALPLACRALREPARFEVRRSDALRRLLPA